VKWWTTTRSVAVRQDLRETRSSDVSPYVRRFILLKCWDVVEVMVGLSVTSGIFLFPLQPRSLCRRPPRTPVSRRLVDRTQCVRWLERARRALAWPITPALLPTAGQSAFPIVSVRVTWLASTWSAETLALVRAEPTQNAEWWATRPLALARRVSQETLSRSAWCSNVREFCCLMCLSSLASVVVVIEWIAWPPTSLFRGSDPPGHAVRAVALRT
jgi:hypothetical protein